MFSVVDLEICNRGQVVKYRDFAAQQNVLFPLLLGGHAGGDLTLGRSVLDGCFVGWTVSRVDSEESFMSGS
jgi:hypothetical protein